MCAMATGNLHQARLRYRYIPLGDQLQHDLHARKGGHHSLQKWCPEFRVSLGEEITGMDPTIRRAVSFDGLVRGG